MSLRAEGEAIGAWRSVAYYERFHKISGITFFTGFWYNQVKEG